jgi:hypothetical protein
MLLMRNLTLSIDDHVLNEVRRYAAERGTTVNAIVRDHLTQIATQEDKAANARRELVELARKSPARLGPQWEWNREDTYEDRVFPRQQHSDLRGGGKTRRAR